MKYDVEKFARTAEILRMRAQREKRLISQPSPEELRLLCEQESGVEISRYGNICADSEPMSRAAKFTKNSVDHPFGDEEDDLLRRCEEQLAQEDLVCMDRIVGDGIDGTSVRLIVPRRFVQLAYAGDRLFKYCSAVDNPTYTIIYFTDDEFENNKAKALPEKDITIRVAFMPDGRMIKINRNTNYFGEFKKGVFAAEDWNAKTKRGGIFLHAGCREDYLIGAHGGHNRVRSLLIALSANGKTSTTCRVLAKKEDEQSWLVQDDGGTLMPDGSFHGFEFGGLFVKTDCLTPADQMETYYGVLKRDSFCENIWLNNDGEFDFFNSEKTSNGRAVISRRDFMHASYGINTEKVENIILITRGPAIPAISKLSTEQAVAFMILGQAMESSAGDPTQAGKIKSVFFYDPFVAGNRAEHANLFYDILKAHPHISCYLINTGGVGEGERYHDISLGDTMAVLNSLFRGGLEDWEPSVSGLHVPKAVREMDQPFLHPERLYSKTEFEDRIKVLNKLRMEAMEAVGGDLNKKIRSVFDT